MEDTADLGENVGDHTTAPSFPSRAELVGGQGSICLGPVSPRRGGFGKGRGIDSITTVKCSLPGRNLPGLAGTCRSGQTHLRYTGTVAALSPTVCGMELNILQGGLGRDRNILSLKTSSMIRSVVAKRKRFFKVNLNQEMRLAARTRPTSLTVLLCRGILGV